MSYRKFVLMLMADPELMRVTEETPNLNARVIKLSKYCRNI